MATDEPERALTGKPTDRPERPAALPGKPEAPRNDAREAERAAYRQRRQAMKVGELPAIAVKVETSERERVRTRVVNIAAEVEHVGNVLASADNHFIKGSIDALARLCWSDPDEAAAAKRLDYLVSVVRGIGPRDEIEALLAVQMAAIHDATMSAAERLREARHHEAREPAMNALNKLARTFTTQIEALKRHRATGEQTVRVEHQHVTVNNGGQAIVAGKVEAGRGGGVLESGGQPHEPSRKGEPCPALLGTVEAVPFAMPGAGSERQARLPLPRRDGRRAQG